ncbi:cation:proton antiporter [Novispirillum sp. DQ9]|uniref:cation:proton antiporter n=1 Tax=Novispirillum sp. DQ9 TaxID=3398612 RepID=UPI003C798CDD
MFDITFVTLAVALLWLVVAFMQPLATRLNLPPTVLFAAVGGAIGSVAMFLLYTPLTDAFNDLVEPIVMLPVPSSVFLYIFLPILVFQATMSIEVRRVMEDAGPILLMAVVAVLVAAAIIGVSLNALFGVPLLACLLLGSIVATTDPAAVIAIFRDIGAPARLTRLVEGESLLNDAAAIALFSLLLGMIVTNQPFDIGMGVFSFTLSFLGGVAIGFAGARLAIAALPLMGGQKAAEATLIFATPYIIYITGDRYLGVSGVVAVVVAGLTVSALVRSRMSPGNWKHLCNVGEQVGFWAGSLVFILAALLVPRILTGISLEDVLMVLAVVAAALVARALVLFGLLPMLSGAGLAQTVNLPYKITILWGGLRGAVTLALALAVTENALLDPDLKRFVAVTASGFVLFTLFVNGLTLRPMIRVLGLDRLSPVDQALRGQVVALALADVRDEVTKAGQKYEIPPAAVRTLTRRYEARMHGSATAGGIENALTERERLALALLALAARERELIFEYHEQGALSPAVVERLFRHAERLQEAVKAEGRVGYSRLARASVEFARPFRLANAAHRYLRIEKPLNREMAARFEMLLVLRLALTELRLYVRQRVLPLLGDRIADIVLDMLHTRLTATTTALDALRLQYPDYADALEQSFLSQLALRQELAHYDTLRVEGLLGPELHEALRRATLADARKERQKRPRLDLGLNTRDLISQFSIFARMPADDLERVCKLLRPTFILPGEAIIQKGERGRGMYFISSGAVEIHRAGQSIRLGRGDFFGEMALISGRRRAADVVALTYCQLLLLDESDFEDFLNVNPGIKAYVEDIVQARETENRKAPPAGGG